MLLAALIAAAAAGEIDPTAGSHIKNGRKAPALCHARVTHRCKRRGIQGPQIERQREREGEESICGSRETKIERWRKIGEAENKPRF